MTDAIGYARVSTRDQAENGKSLNEQIASIKRYAQAHGYDLPRGIYQDVASGGPRGSDRREELRDALKAAGELNCPVLVSSVDRLTRKAGDVDELVSSGIAVIDISKGRLLSARELGIKATSAAYELKRTRIRGRKAAERAGSRGSPSPERGGAARGADQTRQAADRAERVNHELDRIERELGRRLSLRDAARELNKLAFDGSTSWNASTLHKYRKQAVRFVEDTEPLPAPGDHVPAVPMPGRPAPAPSGNQLGEAHPHWGQF